MTSPPLSPTSAYLNSSAVMNAPTRLPSPYPVACRPQAWDAAALLYLLRF